MDRLRYKLQNIKHSGGVGEEDVIFGIGIESEFPIFLDISDVDFKELKNLNGFDNIDIPKNTRVFIPYYVRFIPDIFNYKEFIKYSSDPQKIIDNIKRVSRPIDNLQNIIDNYNLLIGEIKRSIQGCGFDKSDKTVYLYILLYSDKLRNIIKKKVSYFISKSEQFFNKEQSRYLENRLNKIFLSFFEPVFSLEMEGTGIVETKNKTSKQKIDISINEIKNNKIEIIDDINTFFGNMGLNTNFMTLDYISSYEYVIGYEDNKFYLLNDVENDEEYNAYGSYHLNITLPYPKIDIRNDGFKEDFQNKHINLMKSIQLIEPLFIGCLTTIRYNSFNDDHKNIENSTRLIFNVEFYNNFLAIQDISTIYDKPESKNSMNNLLLFEILNNFLGESRELNKNKFEAGVDFRINKKYHKPGENKYFGFEFRFLDHFNHKHLGPILRLIFMLAEYLNIKDIKINKNPVPDIFIKNIDYYSNLIINIIKEGWNTEITQTYIDDLKNYLELELKKDNCYNVLNEIYQNLKDFCKNNKSQLKYLQYVDDPKYLETKEQFPNVNRENYNHYLKLQLGENLEILLKRIHTEINLEFNHADYESKFYEKSKINFRIIGSPVIEEDIPDLYAYLEDHPESLT